MQEKDQDQQQVESTQAEVNSSDSSQQSSLMAALGGIATAATLGILLVINAVVKPKDR